MSDSGRQLGDCPHGVRRERCEVCEADKERAAWLANKAKLHKELDEAGVPTFDGEECRIAARVRWLLEISEQYRRCMGYWWAEYYLESGRNPPHPYSTDKAYDAALKEMVRDQKRCRELEDENAALRQALRDAIQLGVVPASAERFLEGE